MPWFRPPVLLLALLLLAAGPACARAETPPATASVALDEFLAYDRTLPLSPVLTERPALGGAAQYALTYRSAHDQTVTALFSLPPGASKERPVPVILLMHGLGGRKEDLFGLVAPMLALRGYASLAIDAAYHGARRRDDEPAPQGNRYFYRTRDGFVQTVIDLRRAIDFLETRPEIDAERIGYFGVSMGGILGAIAAGAEPRIAAPVLVVAGGNLPLIFTTSSLRLLPAEGDEAKTVERELTRIFAPVEPLYWVGRISPRPVLMLNGRQDDIVPATTGEALFAAAKEPKEIYWYDAGHGLPPLEVATRSFAFFDKHLKPAGSAPGP